MTTYFALLILSLIAATRAENDWTQPCLSGVCSYDLPSTNGSSGSGSMKIWGSQTAIGDITEAAGWKILGCSPDALSQDIRLVCMGGSDATMCQHLYQGHGAVDTIVRLPESCGKGPFARVAKAWVPADQSIPASIAARIVRRDGSQPQVQAITLDTNYAAVNNTKTGSVNLAIKGANVPGVNSILANDTSASQRRSRLNSRQLSNFVADATNSISNAISSANTVDINDSKALPAADFSKKASLFDKSVSCPPVSASVSVDVDCTAHAVVTLGVAATGTIVPPKISDFSIIASVTADISGELDLTADLSGTLDSGSIKLFETGIPGLDFPGILSIGPSFEVNANAKATLDLNVDMTLGINYNIENAQLFFPPKGKSSGGSFSLGDTPLKLSADTNATATGTIEGHIIPSINLGLSALGVVDATIFLDMDASATMKLTVNAQAGASATIQQANKRQDDEDDDGSDDDDDSADDSSDDGSDDGSSDTSDDGSDDTSDTSDDTDASDDEDTSADDPTSDTSDSDPSDGTDSASDSADDGSGSDVDDSNDEDTSEDDPADTDSSTAAVDPTETDPSTDDDTASDDSDEDDSDSSSTTAADPTQTSTTTDADDSTDDDTTSDDSDASSTTAVDPTQTATDTDDSTDDDSDSTTSADSDASSTTTDDPTQTTTDADASTTTSDLFASATPTDGVDDSDSNNSTSATITSDPLASALDDADSNNSTSTSATITSDPLASATPTDSADGSDSNNSTSASATSSTATSTSSAPLASVTTTADASFGGSFVISAGLDVSAGATGSFFGLFDKSTKVSLFQKDFELLSKTFGDNSDNSDARRSFSPRRIPRARRFALQRRDLSCLSNPSEPVSLADESIPGKSL
ncbi:hypothetical protein C8R44DRAFT_141912 [Mycena epipterygia]|nr:hypothetical protein C8R44DRAFT_141912 [Mycena epipterygia]